MYDKYELKLASGSFENFIFYKIITEMTISNGVDIVSQFVTELTHFVTELTVPKLTFLQVLSTLYTIVISLRIAVCQTIWLTDGLK